MDHMYGVTAAQDCFRIDDLLDLSNDDLFSSSSADTDPHHIPSLLPQNSSSSVQFFHTTTPHFSSTDFTNNLCVPTDDVAELEWLSRFVDDSFSDLPTGEIAGAPTHFPNDASSSGRARSKRSRVPSTLAGANNSWTCSPEVESPTVGKPRSKRESSPSNAAAGAGGSGVRRCAHCASEKTPQWRTGPMGPKTLCNACGVRYKSGRLVPEYRPAASPTFVLTQHSNSHRKVMELRRQKEVVRQEQQQLQQQQPEQQQQQQEQLYPHRHGFQVC